MLGRKLGMSNEGRPRFKVISKPRPRKDPGELTNMLQNNHRNFSIPEQGPRHTVDTK